MLQNVSLEVSNSTNVKADKAPQAPLGYSTPKLVNLGKAHTLVQGSDLYKMFVDANRNYRD